MQPKLSTIEKQQIEQHRTKDYLELVTLFDKKQITFRVFSLLSKKVPLRKVEFDKGDLNPNYL